MEKIDARGRACPEPVMMVREAIKENICELEILVDNEVASRNVSRFLSRSGYNSQISKDGEIFIISGIKDSSKIPERKEEKTENTSRSSSVKKAILITKNVMGGSDDELGEILIKSFLGTLTQIDNIPARVALMNEGVKLALKGTSSCEHLQELEKLGVEILVCGTCTKHFGITDKVGTGVISNMFDITEGILSADNTITF